MKTVAIIQARMGSTRLPGKVLKDIAGQPMLARVVTRAARSDLLDEVIVAATTGPADEPIIRLCRERHWPWFRGSEDDVLDRYYRAAAEHKADVVVRLTSDCPVLDAELTGLVVGEFFDHGPPDYAANTLPPRTFPRGLDVEVIGFDALERAWREDTDPAWREHVTPYLYRHPERFRLHAVRNDADLSAHRWVVDTAEDLAFVRKLYEHFEHDRFSWRDVLAACEEHPEWRDINRHVVQKELK